MRRVFIIRRDLHLTAGKMAAMVGHAAELYWLNALKNGGSYTCYEGEKETGQAFEFTLPYEVWTDYINGIYTKTICEARNLNTLMKAKAIADEMGLQEDVDYGFINDKCLTELKPENKDGTTTVGMWFAPLNDEKAHKISKKFPLLKEHSTSDSQDVHVEQFYVIKCKDGRYLCKGPFGAIPYSTNAADGSVIRYSSLIDARLYLVDVHEYMKYVKTLQGATIEKIALYQKIEVQKSLEASKEMDIEKSETERIRKFNEVCEQSKGGLQTFRKDIENE